MVEEAADKWCQFVLTHGGHHDCVVPMSKFWRVKAQVAREEGRLTKAAQKNHDLFVFCAFAAYIETDLASSEVPAFEQSPLSVDNFRRGRSRTQRLQYILCGDVLGGMILECLAGEPNSFGDGLF